MVLSAHGRGKIPDQTSSVHKNCLSVITSLSAQALAKWKGGRDMHSKPPLNACMRSNNNMLKLTPCIGGEVDTLKLAPRETVKVTGEGREHSHTSTSFMHGRDRRPTPDHYHAKGLREKETVLVS
ncbi:hypothetical protein KIL84_013954 [Mauremys mutica]|uniref:Uncharacterized protein n=1 Tax=Mauremys mutica TaxID=74926 RepID=A0A9D4ASZ5_9SAUR|nr:hypothetical protein KIL84_013954 [Mauremys mutica]